MCQCKLGEGETVISHARESQLEQVAEGFSFPTSLTFDETGTPYIAEAGLPFGGAQPGGRVWKIEQDGHRSLLAHNLRQPVNGLTFYRESLYLSERGHFASFGTVHGSRYKHRHLAFLFSASIALKYTLAGILL